MLDLDTAKFDPDTAMLDLDTAMFDPDTAMLDLDIIRTKAK